MALSNNKWDDWKSAGIMVYKVDNLESGALSILYENSLRMGNESNFNVEVATVSPRTYLDDLCEDILKYVSYVTKSPAFQLTSYDNGQLIFTNYSCDSLGFDNIDEIKSFLKDKGQFSILILYTIVKYVNLDKLESKFIVRYKEIENVQKKRDSKIDLITNESGNNS